MSSFSFGLKPKFKKKKSLSDNNWLYDGLVHDYYIHQETLPHFPKLLWVRLSAPNGTPGVGWLIGWGLTAFATQFRSYRAWQ